MAEVAYLSETGEVKIPLTIRTRLGLKPGQKFDVRARGQDVMLVQLGLASTEQVREFVAWNQKQPKSRTTRLDWGGPARGSRKKTPRKKSARRSGAK